MNRRQLFGATMAAVMGLWTGRPGQGREWVQHNTWAPWPRSNAVELSATADRLVDALLSLPGDLRRAELERLRHGNEVLHALVASRLAGLHKQAESFAARLGRHMA